MHTHIALLRGINVGGKNTLPMKALAALLRNLGFHNVQTYIQSGNVVFQEGGQRSCAQLGSRIGAEIKKRFGIETHVLILTSGELKAAMLANPFPGAASEPKTLHLFFMDGEPEHADLAALESIKASGERFSVQGCVFYLQAPAGIGRSKLAAKAERLLGVCLTSRNWRTVSKLMEMADEIDASTGAVG
jgi:uncharacterized protein (DUF1697 family)